MNDGDPPQIMSMILGANWATPEALLGANRATPGPSWKLTGPRRGAQMGGNITGPRRGLLGS